MSIKLYDVGQVVQEVQNALRRSGISFVDREGAFGPYTDKAVRTFQGQHGLAVTGVVDQATWQALGLPGPVPDGRAQAVD